MGFRKMSASDKARADERKAEFKALCDRIAAMNDDERAKIVDRMSVVVNVDQHAFSVKNSCLIYFQKPNATIVGGFHSWRKVGRAVRKGEHGFKIWIPIQKKFSRPDTGTEETEMRFMMGTVFDITQTDIIDTEAQAVIDRNNELHRAQTLEDCGYGDEASEIREKYSPEHIAQFKASIQ